MTADAYVLSGAGNDFLALVEPEAIPAPEVIVAWCRRGLSVGADGLFVLDRQADVVNMRYWNADGGRADLCLNGSRCAAQLAFHLGWGQDDRLTLETAAGALAARRLDDCGVTVALPDLIGEAMRRAVTVDDGGRQHAFDAWSLSVGVPHLVVPWSTSVADVPIDRLGPKLRSHPDLGPDGANVDFVRFGDDDTFELRTFERGVEGETLACGTGVVASAAVGVARGRLRLPVTARTAGGFRLVVEGEARSGRIREAGLGGDARILGRIRLFPAATRLPAPVRWRP